MILKAVVLAAGAARRFGSSKLTVPFGGRPLMAGALDVALAAPVEQVILVIGQHGQHGEDVAACAQALQPAALAAGRLRLIDALHADEGMGASLSAGVAEIGSADGVFVFLADMPAVPGGIPALLAGRLAEGVDAVAPVWKGRRGHPVLFGRSLLPVLLRLRDDEGARATLANLGSRLALIDAPSDGVLLDIDTVKDLSRRTASVPKEV